MIDVIHTFPVDDYYPHVTEGYTEGNVCWCNPHVEELEGGVLVIHKSYDQRESYEQGRKLQ